MKSPHHPDLETAVEALFRRCPALCGFAVQELRTLPTKREVVFRDVSIQPWAGRRASEELLGEIAGAPTIH